MPRKLGLAQARSIIREVATATTTWRMVAGDVGARLVRTLEGWGMPDRIVCI